MLQNNGKTISKIIFNIHTRAEQQQKPLIYYDTISKLSYLIRFLYFIITQYK